MDNRQYLSNSCVRCVVRDPTLSTPRSALRGRCRGESHRSHATHGYADHKPYGSVILIWTVRPEKDPNNVGIHPARASQLNPERTLVVLSSLDIGGGFRIRADGLRCAWHCLIRPDGWCRTTAAVSAVSVPEEGESGSSVHYAVSNEFGCPSAGAAAPVPRRGTDARPRTFHV